MASTTQEHEIFSQFGKKYGVNPQEVSKILKATAFKLPTNKNGQQQYVTDEQMTALLVVANAFGLNPFTKEIYAFPDKSGGITPILGIDGWMRICNEHPQFDGVEYRYSDKLAELDTHAKKCPEYIEAVIYRKDRTRPIVIREYAEECYIEPYKSSNGYVNKGPWQTHTKRQLRHKAFAQAARLAFGFSGIYDEDEGVRIANAREIEANAHNTMNTPIEYPTYKENPPLSLEEQYQSIVIKLDLNQEMCEQYINSWAEHSKVSRERVLDRVVKNETEFAKTITGWLNSQKLNSQTMLENTSPQNTNDKVKLSELRQEAIKLAETVGLENPYSKKPEAWTAKECQSIIAQAKTKEEKDNSSKAVYKYIDCPKLEGQEETEVYSSQCIRCENREGCPSHTE